MNGDEDIVRFVFLQDLIDGSREILDCLTRAEEYALESRLRLGKFAHKILVNC